MTSPDPAGPNKPGLGPSESTAPGACHPAAARPSRWWLVVCVLAVVLGLFTIFLSAAALYLAL